MLSTDRLLFEPGSEVRERLAAKSGEYESLTIVVFARRSLKFQAFSLSPNTRVIPTDSLQSWRYLLDALSLGKGLPRPDLVTAQDPFETGLVGAWLARHHQAKLQLQVHTDFLNPFFARQSLLNLARVWLARYLLPKADLIRVVSRRIEQSLLAVHWPLKAPITIEPVTIDVERIKSAPITADLHAKYPQFNKIILMASRLTWEKNLELAVEATAIALKSAPNLGLVIVGAGLVEAKLRLLISNLGVQKNVIIEPWTQQLSSYYKTADLFLNTSYYEGYGRTLLEAQACGLPVVSTDVGVANEIGVIITPAEPAALATVLVKTLAS